MRLILHIGMGKTGTSTLQRSLRFNRELLSEHGVLFPDAGERPNHNALICLVRPIERLPREFRANASSDPEAVRRIGADVWASIGDQVTGSPAHTTVLSGEYFFHLVREAGALRALLNELFTDIQVVSYVRHPTGHYLARLQQNLKASAQFVPPGQYTIRIRRCLEHHLEAFDDQVAVRAFDRSQLVDGCVVRDFLCTFVPGGDELAQKITVKNINESMSAEAMCILQRLRRYGWPDQNDVFAAESDHVLEVLTAMGRQSAQTPARLKPAIGAALARHHRSEVEWLQERFGVVFPEYAEYEADGGGDEPVAGWLSQEVPDLLDVDPAEVDRTLFCLMKELASTSIVGKAALRAEQRR